jgi:hypothetical protein
MHMSMFYAAEAIMLINNQSTVAAIISWWDGDQSGWAQALGENEAVCEERIWRPEDKRGAYVPWRSGLADVNN